tara:strand:- start:912 stop:2180 length:1269 start_codon:yes stop_codon:yes gene_type:complete
LINPYPSVSDLERNLRILAVSEHFLPRIAGTTEYVLQVCTALADLGHEVHLLIPGELEEDRQVSGYPFAVTALGVGWPPKSDPDRVTRYKFCERVSDFSMNASKRREFDVLHILFGLFVAETLPGPKIADLGLPILLTVHNLPPHECRRSWSGDKYLRRIKDFARVQLVSQKNRIRLNKQSFDAYIVPSSPVKQLLGEIRNTIRIETIPHGYDKVLVHNTPLPQSRRPKPDSPCQLLTVGGWMPHKQQHLIPQIAASLKQAGMNFTWDLAGPSRRSPEYEESILNSITRLGVQNQVRVLGPVSNDHLKELYQNANLYVQPSREEGFCITALNAAAMGIPVIGCYAGAIPEICMISGGKLVTGNATNVTEAIRTFVADKQWLESPTTISERVRRTYSWHISAEKLVGVYSDMASNTCPPCDDQ